MFMGPKRGVGYGRLPRFLSFVETSIEKIDEINGRFDHLRHLVLHHKVIGLGGEVSEEIEEEHVPRLAEGREAASGILLSREL